jgi:hypothetical protein
MSRIQSLLTATAFLALLPAADALAAKLPQPYVSRALDAVLVPVDDSVRAAFSLGSQDRGVLVLAVQPDGVADVAGVRAGDIISRVEARPVVEPIDVDEIFYYWLKQGRSGFALSLLAGGQSVTVFDMTMQLFEEVIDVTTITTWESYSYSSFSYAEYTMEYSEEISASYAASESLIEEAASSAEFAEELNAAETDPQVMDTDNDGTPDAMDNDDDGDGVPDGSDTDPGADDAATDVGPGADAGGEEIIVDDGGDAGADDGGGGEEEVVE